MFENAYVPGYTALPYTLYLYRKCRAVIAATVIGISWRETAPTLLVKRPKPQLGGISSPIELPVTP